MTGALLIHSRPRRAGARVLQVQPANLQRRCPVRQRRAELASSSHGRRPALRTCVPATATALVGRCCVASCNLRRAVLALWTISTAHRVGTWSRPIFVATAEPHWHPHLHPPKRSDAQQLQLLTIAAAAQRTICRLDASAPVSDPEQLHSPFPAPRPSQTAVHTPASSDLTLSR